MKQITREEYIKLQKASAKNIKTKRTKHKFWIIRNYSGIFKMVFYEDRPFAYSGRRRNY